MTITAGSLKLSALESEAGSISLSSSDPVNSMSFLNERTARSLSLTFILNFTGSITVDWGDGNTDPAVDGGSTTHNYADPGTYFVVLTGDVATITSLVINTQGVSSLNMPAGNIITTLDLINNQLSSTNVSNILILLDENDLPNGTAILTMMPVAPPNATGLIAKENLLADGWSVLVDP